MPDFVNLNLIQVLIMICLQYDGILK